jgi:hypothetical protein
LGSLQRIFRIINIYRGLSPVVIIGARIGIKGDDQTFVRLAFSSSNRFQKRGLSIRSQEIPCLNKGRKIFPRWVDEGFV